MIWIARIACCRLERAHRNDHRPGELPGRRAGDVGAVHRHPQGPLDVAQRDAVLDQRLLERVRASDYESNEIVAPVHADVEDLLDELTVAPNAIARQVGADVEVEAEAGMFGLPDRTRRLAGTASDWLGRTVGNPRRGPSAGWRDCPARNRARCPRSCAHSAPRRQASRAARPVVRLRSVSNSRTVTPILRNSWKPREHSVPVLALHINPACLWFANEIPSAISNHPARTPPGTARPVKPSRNFFK